MEESVRAVVSFEEADVIAIDIGSDGSRVVGIVVPIGDYSSGPDV